MPINGDTLAVGAVGDDDNGSQSGSAYIFVQSGSSWSQQAKITPTDTDEDDLFAASVSISGDTVAIGSPNNNGNVNISGSVYVYVRNGTTWNLQGKLIVPSANGYDAVGANTAIRGDVVVTASIIPSTDDARSNTGEVFVFSRAGTEWTYDKRILSGDLEPRDQFGRSIDISGGTFVVGARAEGTLGLGAGSAYVFEEYHAELPPPPTPEPVYVPSPPSCDLGNACNDVVNNCCSRCHITYPNVIGVCV